MKRYLSFRNFTISAGISHQQSNLVAMGKEAFLSGRSLCLPSFRLTGSHNFGREVSTQMGEYYDLDRFRIAGKRIDCLSDRPEGISWVSSRHDSAVTTIDAKGVEKDLHAIGILRRTYEKIYPEFSGMDVELPVHPSLRKIAENNAAGISAKSAWVHVRRGDRTKTTGSSTTPESIRRQLRHFVPDADQIYIATDEADLRLFSPLAEHYDVVCVEDFRNFLDLAREDNYKLFLVEQEFSNYFKYRISTFQTNDPRFKGWLVEKPGWQ